MPQTDSLGQNVPYSVLSDKPNAQTLGQGIVEGLVPRSVMRFSSRSERGATIVDPVAGMTTWIDDVKVMEVFDGLVWTTMAAGSSTWSDISLATGWATAPDGDPANNQQGPLQYRVVNMFGDLTLMFRGGIYRPSGYPSSVPSSFIITSTPLPANARPVTKRTPLLPVSDSGSTRIALKFDIQTDGHISVWGFGSQDKPAWIGFNGVFCSL